MYFFLDNAALVTSNNDNYGSKMATGSNNRASDTSLQSESTQPDLHPFFKVRFSKQRQNLTKKIFFNLDFLTRKKKN